MCTSILQNQSTGLFRNISHNLSWPLRLQQAAIFTSRFEVSHKNYVHLNAKKSDALRWGCCSHCEPLEVAPKFDCKLITSASITKALPQKKAWVWGCTRAVQQVKLVHAQDLQFHFKRQQRACCGTAHRLQEFAGLQLLAPSLHGQMIEAL